MSQENLRAAQYIEQTIQDLFTYHPANDVELRRFQEIRDGAKELARAIFRNRGDKVSDADTAIQKLRECVYFAIASIVVPNTQLKSTETPLEK